LWIGYRLKKLTMSQNIVYKQAKTQNIFVHENPKFRIIKVSYPK
jgi:hypothetical protein